jgi:hypothetical protein
MLRKNQVFVWKGRFVEELIHTNVRIWYSIDLVSGNPIKVCNVKIFAKWYVQSIKQFSGTPTSVVKLPLFLM